MAEKHHDFGPEYAEQRDDARFPASGFAEEENMSVRRYLATRLSTLKPPMDKVDNPFTLLGSLTLRNWLFFLVAFVAWTWDAFDFFTVSLTVSDLAETFDKTTKDITWGITLVLMMRSVGAITFGVAADRWGRKWPFIVNNILFIILELGTGFCNTYQQFLGVRAIYGIAMGGLYGNAAATALEDVPEKARGIVSGMLQQGYAFGYLLATAFARGLVNTTGHGWRPLFWFGAGVPVLIICFRLCLGETESFMERQRVRAAGSNVGKTFVKEGKVALKHHWLVLLYLVLLMAGFNFMSHGSQVSNNPFRAYFSFSRLVGSLPDYVVEPVQFHSKCRDRHAGCCQLGCYDWWNCHWVPESDVRPSLQHHLHLSHRRRAPVPLRLHWQQGCDRCSFLRAVLRPGRMGCYSYSPDGAVARQFQDIRCRHFISARKSSLLRKLHDRGHDWRAVPTTAKACCGREGSRAV